MQQQGLIGSRISRHIGPVDVELECVLVRREGCKQREASSYLYKCRKAINQCVSVDRERYVGGRNTLLRDRVTGVCCRANSAHVE